MNRFPRDIESKATLDKCQHEVLVIRAHTYNSTRDAKDNEVGTGKEDLLVRGKIFPFVHYQPEDGREPNCPLSVKKPRRDLMFTYN